MRHFDFNRRIFRAARDVIDYTPPRSTILFPGCSGDYVREAIRIIKPKGIDKRKMVSLPFSGFLYGQRKEQISDDNRIGYSFVVNKSGWLAEAAAEASQKYQLFMQQRGVTMKKLLAQDHLVVFDHVSAGFGTTTFLGMLYDAAVAEGCEQEFLKKTRLVVTSPNPGVSFYKLQGTPMHHDAGFSVPVDYIGVEDYVLPTCDALPGNDEKRFRITPVYNPLYDDTPERTNIGFASTVARMGMRLAYMALRRP
jgi:hypothetical protein